MNFALDSSFALTWVLEDEATVETDRVLDSLGEGTRALVPALWRWEVANALLSIERQKRATRAAISSHLLFFRSLPIDIDGASLDRVWDATQLLAQRHLLTSYDAAYLELALRRGVPLASLDQPLRAAAKAEDVPLLPEWH